MESYCEVIGALLYQGDCIEVMAELPEASFDTVITDPPYGLGFMGRAWDTFTEEQQRRHSRTTEAGETRDGRAMKAGKYDQSLDAHRGFQEWCREWAAAALRVTKPGGMFLCFGGTRTYHRLACAIEDAGWELRDCLMWLYGSGFPKSKNLDGDFEGWGTALKPAWEPIILAMRPTDGTFAENAQRHGVAGLHIDGGRIGTGEGGEREGEESAERNYDDDGATDFTGKPGARGGDARGRWPANLLLDKDAAAQLDEQSGTLKSGTAVGGLHRRSPKTATCYGKFQGEQNEGDVCYGDVGGASRFFYTAKASGKDRGNQKYAALPLLGIEAEEFRNTHPTVKPTDLMEYLCKLTATPTGGSILDPFAGSGTTLIAARRVGRPCVGIELSEEYCAIAKHRLHEQPRKEIAQLRKR